MNTVMKHQQQRSYLLVAATATALFLFIAFTLPSTTRGFASVHPPSTFRIAKSRSLPIHDPLSHSDTTITSPVSSPLRAFNNNHNNDNNSDGPLGDDFRDLTRAAGNIVKKVGGKVLELVEQGGSKLWRAVTQGAETVKHTLALDQEEQEEHKPKPKPSTTATTTTTSSPLSSPLFVDTEDELLFRNIFGEGLFPSSTQRMVGSVDHLVEQAAGVLNKDETVRSLLGPNLRYGRPFSQSSRTTTINGQTTTSSVQASFEVWGSQGQGVATVLASDNSELQSMDLEVNGRLYRFNLAGPSHSRQKEQQGGFFRRNTFTDEKEKDSDDDSSASDVEILDGIRRPPSSSSQNGSGGIMDAEIEGKTYL